MADAVIKEWTRLLGSSSSDGASSISTAADGSIYITGWTRGTLDGQTNSGQSDAFISKYSSDGSKVWTRLLGSSYDDYGHSIGTAADGSIYITGVTEGTLDGQTNSGQDDAFISKYSSDGTKVWTRLLGSSSSDGAHSIRTAADGSIYITGWTRGTLDGQTNSGQGDAFISKYSSDGTKIWTRLLGSSSYDEAHSISTATDGSIYITGSTEGTLDGQTNSGQNDAFISKYSSDGSKVWTRLLGSSSYEHAKSISTATDGSIYITGWTGGTLDGQNNSGRDDVFISKFSAVGITPTYNVSNTYAKNLVGDVLTGAPKLTQNTFDAKFYNLGGGRYGVQQKGKSTIDEITGVFTLSFNDKTVSVSSDIKGVFEQVTGKETKDAQMYRLYNAAFARFPDASGLRYWINEYTRGITDYRNIAQSFLNSEEFKTRYGANNSNTDFINNMYRNILGRLPDEEGRNYWVSNLDSGRDTRVNVLGGFAESTENKNLFSQVTGFS